MAGLQLMMLSQRWGFGFTEDALMLVLCKAELSHHAVSTLRHVCHVSRLQGSKSRFHTQRTSRGPRSSIYLDGHLEDGGLNVDSMFRNRIEQRLAATA